MFNTQLYNEGTIGSGEALKIKAFATSSSLRLTTSAGKLRTDAYFAAGSSLALTTTGRINGVINFSASSMMAVTSACVAGGYALKPFQSNSTLALTSTAEIRRLRSVLFHTTTKMPLDSYAWINAGTLFATSTPLTLTGTGKASAKIYFATDADMQLTTSGSLLTDIPSDLAPEDRTFSLAVGDRTFKLPKD